MSIEYLHQLSKDPNYIEKSFSGYVNEEDMITLIRKVQKKRDRKRRKMQHRRF